MIIRAIMLGCLWGRPAGHTAANSPVPVYVIAGQSNAVGGAAVSDLPAPPAGQYSYATLYDAVQFAEQLACPSDDGVAPTCDTETAWVGMQPHPTIPTVHGVELSFAREIVQRTGRNARVIKCATNGTNLRFSWDPAAVDGYMLFSRAVRFVAEQRAAIGFASTVAGFIWIQGESDASGTQATADLYEANLRAFVAAVRAEWGASLPFVIARLSNNQTSLANIATVQAAQDAVAGDTEGVYIVDTDDLEIRDGTHYSSQGYVTLGERLADAP